MGTTSSTSGAKTVYVIGSGGEKKVAVPIQTVKNIMERNALQNVLFAFVRDATGDLTVHKGWALYASSDDGWIKIAEEETVDGLFGFKREIVATLVEKKQFNDTIANLEKKIRESGGGGGVTPPNPPIGKIDPSSYGDRDIIRALNDIIQWANNIGNK